MDYEKIWGLPGKKRRAKRQRKSEKLKRHSPMEVEERCIIKFLHLKGLKLGDIVVELSTLYGEDVYTRPSIKYWLQQLKLGRTNLTRQHVGGQRISTIPTLKFDRYFGDLRFFGANNC
jgi:hypothetical protein